MTKNSLIKERKIKAEMELSEYRTRLDFAMAEAIHNLLLVKFYRQENEFLKRLINDKKI